LRSSCLICIGMCPMFLTAPSLKSSNIEILDQLCWSPNKEKDYMRDCMAKKGGGPFYQVVQDGWKRVGYWDCFESWEACESLGVD
jgi:hypothetical protein